MSKLWRVALDETYRLNPRLLLARATLAPLPPYVGNRLRAEVLRRLGFRIGSGTVFWGTPRLSGTGKLHEKLRIGADCWFNVDCFLELGDEIRIGDHVSLGQEVMVLTTTHGLAEGSPERRAIGSSQGPVVIEDGAWLGARCTILPGVVVGHGAVVAAGAVVHQDVSSNTLVGGVPARLIRQLT